MRIFLITALVIVFYGLLAWVINLPQDVGQDVPQGKLNSLSFAPFRTGQSPLLEKFPTPEQIDEDLRLLAQKTHTVRTYSSTRVMDAIPALAKKHGLEMIQGAWVGYVKKDNQAEIQALIRSANAYPDVVKRVMVGNEVLLRGEMEASELIKYIRQVKAAVKQPVSYADVWSMYMKNPEIIKEVDFITIHILPYWEDEPIPVSQAPAHIARIYNIVRKEADTISPGKPILIGESGWPSAGRQRGWAVPSVANEAEFIRGLLKVSAENKFDCNIVEAFNQPWKDTLEGVIGANWGIFTADRKHDVFPLTGKVYENVNWLQQFAYSCVILLGFAAYYRTKLQTLPLVSTGIFLLFTHLLAILLVSQACYAWYTSYNLTHYAKTLAAVGLNVLLVFLLVQRAWHILNHQTNRKTGLWLYGLYLFLVTLAIHRAFDLATDGRYISFPFILTLIPVVGLLGLMVAHYWVSRPQPENTLALDTLLGNQYIVIHPKIIGYSLLVMVVGLIIGEIRAFMVGRDFIAEHPEFMQRFGRAFVFSITNLQLVQWSATLIVLAFAFLLCKQRTYRLS